MQSIRLIAGVIILTVLFTAIQWAKNQPQDVGEDVPAGKLRSLSFAPYRAEFSPAESHFPLPEHIDEDLKLVADKTFSVRTYSTLGGMQPTAEYARKYGVEVIQGAWLGNGPAGNQKEIEAFLKSVNANTDVVKRVIVGNEVLLRKDMSVDELIGYIRRVKQSVQQQVSYADVWSIYLKYPQLFREVDFITIHILPYWEDEPVAIERAADHVEAVFRQIKDKAASMGIDKPILIGESGWPAAGRQRAEAVPSLVNEARFIRSLIHAANRNGFDYNIVEAFNQWWKSYNEGVVGANWGLFSVDRKPVFPLVGKVAENDQWPVLVIVSTVLWLVLISLYAKKIQWSSLADLAIYLVLTQLMCIALVSMAGFNWQTSYSVWQYAYTIFITLGNACLGFFITNRSYALLSGQPQPKESADYLNKGLVLFIVLAIIKAFHIALDGRYLSFPVEQFYIPVIGVIGLGLINWKINRKIDFQSVTLSRLTGKDLPVAYCRAFRNLIFLGILGVILGEIYMYMESYDFNQAHPSFFGGFPVALKYTFFNQQLVGWLFCLLVLSVPMWRIDMKQIESTLKPEPDSNDKP